MSSQNGRNGKARNHRKVSISLWPGSNTKSEAPSNSPFEESRPQGLLPRILRHSSFRTKETSVSLSLRARAAAGLLLRGTLARVSWAGWHCSARKEQQEDFVLVRAKRASTDSTCDAVTGSFWV